jgi:uncharacterized coiled-coil protein SlyX
LEIISELFITIDKQNELIKELTEKVIEQDQIIEQMFDEKAAE